MKTWAPKPRRPHVAFPGPGPFGARVTKITGPFFEREILTDTGTLLPVRVAPDTANAVSNIRVHVHFSELAGADDHPLTLSEKYLVTADPRAPFMQLFAGLARVDSTTLVQVDPDFETFLGRLVTVYLKPHQKTGAAEIDRITSQRVDHA